MSSGMSVEAHGVEQATAHLHDLGERGSDVRRVSAKLRDVYLKSNAKRYSGYARWKPLDEDTKRIKRRAGLDERVERATGALHEALTAESASGQVDERGRTEMRFGASLFYARWQDKGTKTQPKRKLISISKADKQVMVGLIGDYVARAKA